MKGKKFKRGYWLIIFMIWMLHCQSGSWKVLYINSYHAGYGPSDEIYAGIQEGFSRESKIVLETFFMDTKQQPALNQIQVKVNEIVTLMSEFKPDLVISDIRMPKMSGFELASMLRKRNPDIKIILMTGYADEAEVLDQQKTHGFPFFTKPADLQTTVANIVQEVLAGKYKS